ncbi:hypothetical protein ACTFIZ_007912 [Dictyostelium cf. discoideum]
MSTNNNNINNIINNENVNNNNNNNNEDNLNIQQQIQQQQVIEEQRQLLEQVINQFKHQPQPIITPPQSPHQPTPITSSTITNTIKKTLQGSNIDETEHHLLQSTCSIASSANKSCTSLVMQSDSGPSGIEIGIGFGIGLKVGSR